jgi:hypothetical protein
MKAFRAHVKNGRLVVDEPTELPEGSVLFLVPADEDDGAEDDGLEAALEEGLDDIEAGRIVDEETIRAMLRAHR